MLKYAILSVALIFSTCTSAFAQEGIAKEDFFGGFDGRWEGTFNFVAKDAFSTTYGRDLPSQAMAFTINGKQVHVYRKTELGDWHDVKPGEFIIVPFKTSAVVTTIDSGSDDDSGWVESWNFTITHKDRDGLLVAFSRSVNNYKRSYEDVSEQHPGRFFYMAFGEMTRVPAP